MAALGESSAQFALRDPDIRLMLRIRDDQPGAFEELVNLYQHRVIAVLHHLMGNHEEAEDLAQEVFFRVYRGRQNYKPRAKFCTWLFTIANNLGLNAIRTRKRRPTVQMPTDDSGPLGPRPTEDMAQDKQVQPLQRMQQQELAAVIQQAIQGLGERQRMAVVLNKFEDMSYAEIGEVMNLNAKAVKSLLSRARLHLRAALASYVYMEDESVPETSGTEEE